jgi:hypothetical protein
MIVILIFKVWINLPSIRTNLLQFKALSRFLSKTDIIVDIGEYDLKQNNDVGTYV